MKSPFTGKEMSVQREWRTMKFRKEEFDVLFHFYKCKDTGEQFEDEAFAELNYNQLMNQYRTKYGMPFRDQIVSIREKYHLSARKMSEILGLGINSYRLYESGEIPSQSNARLIQLANNPLDFRNIVRFSREIDQQYKVKIFSRIDKLIENGRRHKKDQRIRQYLLGDYTASEKTGYREPDLDKFSQMVLFFSEKLSPWKVKMCKLLFYSDFLHFKKTGYSISGMPYEAYPMGPVPIRFDGIYDYIINTGIIDKKFQVFDNGGLGEQFFPGQNQSFNPDIFSGEELTILSQVTNKFAKSSTQEIIEISHQEKAWKDNQSEQGIIDYRLGFELIGI